MRTHTEPDRGDAGQRLRHRAFHGMNCRSIRRPSCLTDVDATNRHVFYDMQRMRCDHLHLLPHNCFPFCCGKTKPKAHVAWRLRICMGGQQCTSTCLELKMPQPQGCPLKATTDLALKVNFVYDRSLACVLNRVFLVYNYVQSTTQASNSTFQH